MASSSNRSLINALQLSGGTLTGPVSMRHPGSAVSGGQGVCLRNNTGGTRWYKLVTVQESQTKAKFRLQGLVHPNDWEAYSFDMTISVANNGGSIDAPLVMSHSTFPRNVLGSTFEVILVIESPNKVHLYAGLVNNGMASLSLQAMHRNTLAGSQVTYYDASAAFAVALNGAITSAEDIALTGAVSCHYVSSSARVMRFDNGFLGISASNGALPTAPLHVAASNDSGVSVQTVGQISSTVAAGVAPLAVQSTTLCSNLNAQLLAGQDSNFYVAPAAFGSNAGAFSSNAISQIASSGLAASNLSGSVSVENGGTGHTTLTLSKVLVGNGSNAVLQPSSLHWDMTNLRLGIGTSNPITSLDVRSAIATPFVRTSNLITSNMTVAETVQLGNVVANRRLVLFSVESDDHQFQGFGINSGILRYQVNAPQNAHVWFGGTSSTTSTEIMRCSVNGGLSVDGRITSSNVQTVSLFTSNATIAQSFAFATACNFVVDEFWGVRYNGSSNHPLKVANASLSVGYDVADSNHGVGNAYISGVVGVGTRQPAAPLHVAASNAGGVSVQTVGQISSTAATGVAPLAVRSTTLCSNLNAQLLAGQGSNFYVAPAAFASNAGAFASNVVSLGGALSNTSLSTSNVDAQYVTVRTVHPFGLTPCIATTNTPGINQNMTEAYLTRGLISCDASNALWNALAVSSNGALTTAVRTDGRVATVGPLGVGNSSNAPACPVDISTSNANAGGLSLQAVGNVAMSNATLGGRLNVTGSARIGRLVNATFVKTLGTTLGDGVNICAVTSGDAAAFAFTLQVVHGAAGNNNVKVYDVVSLYNATFNGWHALRPRALTGAVNGNDFEVEINHGTAGSMTLRLRRSAVGSAISGANITCTLQLTENASETVTVSDSATTYTALGAPSATHPSSLLTAGRGEVVLGSNVRFSSSPVASMNETWGFRYSGGSNHPFKVVNASLTVGYDPAGANMGAGSVYVASNVGVGTSTPAAPLHVAANNASGVSLQFEGGLLFNNNNNNGARVMLFGADTTSAFHGLAVQPSAVFIATPSSNHMIHQGYVSGGVYTPVVTTTMAGRMGVGTSAPTAPLHVAASNASGVSILASHDIVAFSDARLKHDVRPIEGATERLAALRGYTFAREPGEDAHRYAGLIAQEVQAALPEVVQTDPESGLLSVAYGNFTALLVQAVNELTRRVAAIERVGP